MTILYCSLVNQLEYLYLFFISSGFTDVWYRCQCQYWMSKPSYVSFQWRNVQFKVSRPLKHVYSWRTVQSFSVILNMALHFYPAPHFFFYRDGTEITLTEDDMDIALQYGKTQGYVLGLCLQPNHHPPTMHQHTLMQHSLHIQFFQSWKSYYIRAQFHRAA